MKALSVRAGGILDWACGGCPSRRRDISFAKIDDLDTKVAGLEDQVGVVEVRPRSLPRAPAAMPGKNFRPSRKAEKIEACIPEVQKEINGLGVEVEAGFAYIENNSQVSTYCQSVVYPQSQGEP